MGMLWRLLLLTTALGACDRSSTKPDPARDLSRALHTPPDVPDTAAQRADSQFQTCAFVYDTEERLRECLVVKNRWSAQDAAREIAKYKAKLARALDSLQAVRDSLQREQLRAAEKRWRAEQIAESLAYQAKYGERDRKRRADSVYAASFPVWGSNESKSYFSSSPACAPAMILPDWDRVLFRTATEAEEAGFTASYDSDRRCKVHP